MLALVIADAPHTQLAPFLELFSIADIVIAADGGTQHVLRYGITPHIIIGDLDSVDPAVLSIMQDRGVEIIRYHAEKDETDLELAVFLALERGATQIRLLGIFGGRPDMHWANHLILANPKVQNLDIAILDLNWEIRLITRHGEFAGQLDQRVSLLPLGDVVGITTNGLRYPLTNETLPAYSVRGVSNQFSALLATIDIEKGQLLVFCERA